MQGWSETDYYLEHFKKVSDELAETIKRKHEDYGRSIGYHGALGLLPRLADKFFRVNTLVWERKSANYESALDSAKDLAAYAISLAVALEYETKQANLLTCEFTDDPKDFNERVFPYADIDPARTHGSYSC